MNRSLALVSAWICAAGMTGAWAQHGHGMGVAGGHGAPPQFPSTAVNSVPKTTAARPAGVSTSMSQSTTVATRVANNPALVARVRPLLPAGTTLQSDAAGFRNQGQFLAALHVSRNLNIPFAQLKAQMTGSNRVSLGQAVSTLRPALGSTTVKSDLRLARLQAKQDLRSAASGSNTNIATRISQNTVLANRIRSLLPSGATVQAATVGFKSEGQFIAAVHVSRNLNIPFSQLQAEIASGKTLGQAITDLKPALTPATIQTDVRTADRQAQRDLEAAERTST
jgi:hypothetical protein